MSWQSPEVPWFIQGESPWFYPHSPFGWFNMVQSYTHFSSSLNGNAPFQLLESQCLRRSSSFIETYRNLACWSMDFPPISPISIHFCWSAPLELSIKNWVPLPMRPTAPQPAALVPPSPPFRPFQPTPPVPRVLRVPQVPRVPLVPQMPRVPQAVASPGTGAWGSHPLGEKNMVLGHFPTNREGKDARVVNVSLLFVGVSEHAGCFSGCSS